MTKSIQVKDGGDAVVIGLDRLQSEKVPLPAPLIGTIAARIHSQLNDLPSRGQEFIDFSQSIGSPLLPHQEWLAHHALKVKPDSRWKHPVVCTVQSRQNGKTFFMKNLILMNLFEWDTKLQIGTAHRLTTSLETFRDLVSTIESNDGLCKQVKRIRWAHGSEEIETITGNRYMVKAGAAAARGISKPEVVYLDECREMKDETTWASMRYTMMAATNPQIWAISSAGDQHSLILNQLRDRGLASSIGNDDDIGYFEWSSDYGKIDDSPKFWQGVCDANPALSRTINPDNIRAVLNDPPEVVQTEVLSRWVATISSAIPMAEFQECGEEDLQLDPEKISWLGLDLSPDRRQASLVIAQKLDSDRFMVKLLHSWTNPISLDDRAVANDIAPYCRKYQVEVLAYSKRTASAVAGRLKPAGIAVTDIDGGLYGQSCDELLGAITSKRLRWHRHANQADFVQQISSAVRLPLGDGGWIIGRRASQANVTACVAAALATHFATRPETEIDILVG